MRKSLLTSVAAAALLLMSCSSSLGELSADNFYVSPDPLVAEGGSVSAVIDGKFPEKYMNKKAVIKVTPELRANDGSAVATGSTATFQGEKVLGNNTTISYKVGGTYAMRSTFDYTDALQSSSLYLTFDARVNGKSVDVPDVKIADGVVATSQLYRRLLAEGACFAPDSFQRAQTLRQEAQIRFLINQAELRKSELGSMSVTEFVNMLRQINREHEALVLKNIEVLAYASPEGGVEYNDNLASKRQDVSEKFVRQQLDKAGLDADIHGKYTAQDWEGFRKLVEASNIQDKDVILRVLSMYSDPEEREQQIRNMSEGFQELASGVLPELRRARLIINYETVGSTDEQLQQRYKEDPRKLTADELLYLATLEDDIDEKIAIYRQAADIYPTDSRTSNNIAAAEIAKGKYNVAQSYTDIALKTGETCPEAYVNKGIMALAEGDIDAAESYIMQGADAPDANSAKGLLNIAKGKYALAETQLSGENTNSEALAHILGQDYTAAQQALSHVEAPDAMTDYLSAIVYARQGNTSEASRYLNSAIQKDPTLSSYADKDIELSAVSK